MYPKNVNFFPYNFKHLNSLQHNLCSKNP
jgi:hypothetical protein